MIDAILFGIALTLFVGVVCLFALRRDDVPL